MAEYVSKNEVKPYRIIFDELIKKVREDVRQLGITLTYNLVGSAKRNLIVRHHNKGFDCDYQIFIQKNNQDLSAKEIKDKFISAFNRYLPSGFKHCENSTTAITIKEVNEKANKVEFSYDIVILRNIEGETQIIRQDKHNNGGFFWNKMPEMSSFNNNIKRIKGKQMWDMLRKIYLKKKTDKNDGKNYLDKKSFQILNEAVNEVLSMFV